MMSFPFQDNINFGMGPYNGTENVLNFQPVFPFANGRLIVPVELGGRKIVKLGGKLPLNLQAGAYYNLVKRAVVILPTSI